MAASRFARRHFRAAIVALFALFVPARALAQDSAPVKLRWVAPPGCSGQREVLARVRKLAGAAWSTETPLHAEATITRNEAGGLHLQLVLRVGDLEGERSIDGKSCEALVGATAVALALLLQSKEPLSEEVLAAEEKGAGATAAGEPGAERTSEDATLSSPRPERAQPLKSSVDEASDIASSREETPSTRGWHALIQLPLVRYALGPLPRSSFGVAVAAGASFESWRFLVEAGAWQQQHLTMSADPEFGADVSRVNAGVRVCRALWLTRLELAPCVTIGFEHVSARGTGAHVAPRTAAASWGAAGVGIHVRLRLFSGLNLVSGVDGQIETSRSRIEIDDVGTIGQLEPAALTVMLGSEWFL